VRKLWCIESEERDREIEINMYWEKEKGLLAKEKDVH
jgi:hypothetical protein